MREHPHPRYTAVAALTSLLVACVSNASYLPMGGPVPTIDDLHAVVYLIGDAGDDSPGRDAVLEHVRLDLQRHVREHPETPVLATFLGDNIYDVGARPAFRDEDLSRLAAQVDALVETPAVRGVFVPGNHDWGKGAAEAEGRTAVEVQQAWLAEIGGERDVRLLPADGCPGPATIHVAGDIHVVVMDTEWLLRLPDDGCGGVDAFYGRLSSVLAGLRGKRVVVAAHHPMATGGPHGGNVSWDQFGPLVYYLAAKSGLGVQDLASGRYSSMLDGLRASITDSGTTPLVMAAGHDHSLQVIRMDEAGVPRYQLVSGSASKRDPVAEIDGTRYATSEHGYMRLDFAAADTRVVVFALLEAEGAVRPVFTCMLTSGETSDGCAEAIHAEGGR